MTGNPAQQDNFFKKFYRSHPIISHLVFIFFAALAMGWICLVFLDIWTHHGSTAKVPNVTNIDSHAAIRALEADGFKAEVTDSVYDPAYTPGKVISTWPRPGAVVKPGREVFLTIASYQTRKVLVDMSLVNVSSRQALNYLEETLGIKNVQIKKVPSQFADLVISAKYNGRPIEPGMKLPVTAKVVLEVGVVPIVTEVDASEDAEYAPESAPAVSAPQHVAPRNDDDDDYSNSAVFD